MTTGESGSDKAFWKIFRNRLGYTDEEIGALRKVKWAQNLPEAFTNPYWIKVEMVKTNRCSVGWKQGDALYFSAGGMLISRKAPGTVCPHAIAALSPVFYTCLDRLSRGEDPENIAIDHVSCTDPGFDQKGLGNNTMKVTFERMPFYQRLKDTLSGIPYMFYRSQTARGPEPGGLPETGSIAGEQGATALPPSVKPSDGKLNPNAMEFFNGCPITDSERDIFLQSEKRMRRIAGMERFKNTRIAVEVVKSDACLAGHGIGDKIYFDSMGRLLTDNLNKPVCSRLLNKIWYRLVIILDRMTDDNGNSLGDGTFSGEVPEVRMSCYGAEFPYGDCGHILMAVATEEKAD
jgi:uncharacterized repeat protein (TIGR04076 family)